MSTQLQLCGNCGNYHCSNFIPAHQMKYIDTPSLITPQKIDTSNFSSEFKDSVSTGIAINKWKMPEDFSLTLNKLSLATPPKIIYSEIPISPIKPYEFSQNTNLPRLTFETHNQNSHLETMQRISHLIAQSSKNNLPNFYQNQIVGIPQENHFFNSSINQAIVNNMSSVITEPISPTFKSPGINPISPIKINKFVQSNVQTVKSNFETFPRQRSRQPIKLSPYKSNISIPILNKQSPRRQTFNQFQSETKSRNTNKNNTNSSQRMATLKQDRQYIVIDKNSRIQQRNINKQQRKVLNSERPPSLRTNSMQTQKSNRIRVQTCTYKDNRCFGVDLRTDKAKQFEVIDETGHIKNHLYK